MSAARSLAPLPPLPPPPPAPPSELGQVVTYMERLARAFEALGRGQRAAYVRAQSEVLQSVTAPIPPELVTREVMAGFFAGNAEDLERRCLVPGVAPAVREAAADFVRTGRMLRAAVLAGVHVETGGDRARLRTVLATLAAAGIVAEPAAHAGVVRACRACGCTQERACPGGCGWVEWDLCSACAAPHAAPDGRNGRNGEGG